MTRRSLAVVAVFLVLLGMGVAVGVTYRSSRGNKVTEHPTPLPAVVAGAETPTPPAASGPTGYPMPATTVAGTPEHPAFYPVPPITYAPTRVLPPTPTPEPTKTPLPDLSGRPTLSPADLSPERLRAMVAWREVENDPRYVLYQLTDTSLGVADADWSPTGRHLALSIATEHPWERYWPSALVVVDLDSREVWRPCEPEDERCESIHTWAPEGDRISYLRAGRLWLAGADGGTRHALPLPEGYKTLHSPGFSPDGRWIAVLGGRIEEDGYHYDLFVFHVGSEAYVRLIPDAGYGTYRWSPSGHGLAHMGQGDNPGFPIGAARVSIADLDSMKVVSRDIGSLSGTEVSSPAPAWLVGEEKVLVTLAFSLGVWTVDVEGNVTRLDEERGTMGRQRLPGLAAPLEGGYCDGAAVSPDGRYVVYSTGGMHLRVLDILSGQRVELGDGDLCPGHAVMGVTWAPQGSRFLKHSGGFGPIALVDASDGASEALINEGGWPSWSPDGRWVAYWVGDAPYVMDVATRESFLVDPMNIGPLYDVVRPVRWAPDRPAFTFIANFRGSREVFLAELRP